jgi:hypothetical protein
MPKALDEFSMARNPYSHDVTPNIDPLITQWQLEAISCQTKKMIRRWDDGTILCADKTGQLNPLLNSGDFKNGVGWEFIISANVYRTPLGQNLIMDEALNRVEVSYLLIPDLSLGYYWHAPEAASDIDPSYIINIDRLFESALSKFKVQNYRWPQSKNSQNLK